MTSGQKISQCAYLTRVLKWIFENTITTVFEYFLLRYYNSAQKHDLFFQYRYPETNLKWTLNSHQCPFKKFSIGNNELTRPSFRGMWPVDLFKHWSALWTEETTLNPHRWEPFICKSKQMSKTCILRWPLALSSTNDLLTFILWRQEVPTSDVIATGNFRCPPVIFIKIFHLNPKVHK